MGSSADFGVIHHYLFEQVSAFTISGILKLAVLRFCRASVLNPIFQERVGNGQHQRTEKQANDAKTDQAANDAR